METATPIQILSEAHILTHRISILRTHSQKESMQKNPLKETLLLFWLVYLIFA